MRKSFQLDLKVARRQSGLTQLDCAHLLGVHRSKISHLECGETEPTVRDLCLLSLIYGKSFDGFLQSIAYELRHDLRQRLASLPPAQDGWIARFNRANTVKRIGRQLEALDNADRAGV